MIFMIPVSGWISTIGKFLFCYNAHRCSDSTVTGWVIIINSYNIVCPFHHIFPVRLLYPSPPRVVLIPISYLDTARLGVFRCRAWLFGSHRTSWPGKGQTITTSNSRYSTWRCISSRISPAHMSTPRAPQRKSSAHRAGIVTQIHHASAFLCACMRSYIHCI